MQVAALDIVANADKVFCMNSVPTLGEPANMYAGFVTAYKVQANVTHVKRNNGLNLNLLYGRKIPRYSNNAHDVLQWWVSKILL